MKPESLLPLHPKDFQILFSLTDGPRHGYGMVRDAEETSGGRVRIDPANLYRSIKRLLRERLIEETEAPAGAEEDDRRRFYQLTGFGLAVVRLEAKRLDDLAAEARSRRLLADPSSTRRS